MAKAYKLKPYFSERTIELIEERNEIDDFSYGRRNKRKKSRVLAFKDAKIYINKTADFILASAKNPVACTFMILTVGLASFTIMNTLLEAKFDHKFFNAMENDPTIPKEVMLRVQNHYYNTKK